jgi:hypothetical protein
MNMNRTINILSTSRTSATVLLLTQPITPGSDGGGQTGSGDFRMTADQEWDSVNDYTF